MTEQAAQRDQRDQRGTAHRTAHIRRSMIITTPVSPEREKAIIDYIQGPNTEPFNVLSDNCSDFVKGALVAVFPDAKSSFRPRALRLPDPARDRR